MAAEISFGTWLRQRRRSLDLTQQALAEQIGCARITLRRIEADALKPSKELAWVLLERFGVSPSDREPWLRFARGLAEMPTAAGSPVSEAPSNLPALLTSFIGRQKELAETARLLAKHRLVTLVGPGGVGKTRLSLKLGEQLLANFAHGIWLLELAPLVGPELIPQTLASIFDIMPPPGASVTEVVARSLRNKEALLIFDNCEHVLDACAQLADTLLRRCPHLKILATSREGMGVLGEALFRVPPLTVPDVPRLLDKYREIESIYLFEERAQLVQTDFSLTMSNIPAVAQICTQLDGIPLAIELAAVHIDLLTPAEIAHQLEKCFDVLSGGNRTALPRQHAIRASIDWSWNLLAAEERVLLQRLAIFAGGWTMTSAQTICGDMVIAGRRIKMLLEQLVKKSLVMVNRTSGYETRYTFHEIVRQYAHEKLIASGEMETLWPRHIAYFVALAETADTMLHRAEQQHWLERMSDELPNLRAVLEFALERDREIALRLAAALGWFWFRLGLLKEGSDWLKKILTVDQRTLSGPVAGSPQLANRPYYVKAVNSAALLAHFRGDYAQARSLLEQSLSAARLAQDQSGAAHALGLLGLGSAWQGDFAGAEAQMNESIDLFRRIGESWGLAFTLNNLGFVRLLRGDYDRARPLFEESLQLAHEVGDLNGTGWPLANLGQLTYQQGDLRQGRLLLEQSLAVGQGTNAPTITHWSRKELGYIALYQNDLKQANACFEIALTECRAMNFDGGVAEMLYALGEVAVRSGEHQKADGLLRQSLTHWQQQGDLRSLVLCLISFAGLAAAVGDWPAAVKRLSIVDAQLQGLGMFLSPIQRIDFDQMVRRARQAVNEPEFARIWSESRHTPLAAALEPTQPISPPS